LKPLGSEAMADAGLAFALANKSARFVPAGRAKPLLAAIADKAAGFAAAEANIPLMDLVSTVFNALIAPEATSAVDLYSMKGSQAISAVLPAL
jgi:hypothetical protein